MDYCSRLLCSSYLSCWSPGEDLKEHFPPKHSDFRDTSPEPLEEIRKDYELYVKDGRWTVGLLDMWCPRAKYVKHSVHIPCWDSFKINPCLWRGVVFGRSFRECFWFGLRETRWARMAYAGNMGREYMMPVQGVGTHEYKSEIEALCWMTYILGCIFSCGIGQVFSICGNAGANCAACYTCHTRARMRNRYGLPPVFGLPLGIDDCLVHLLCFYCASHQEMRELVIRGVDGPGMHAMDVSPDSYHTAKGHEEAAAERKLLVQEMLQNPPRYYSTEKSNVRPDIYSAICANIGKGIHATCKRSGTAMIGATRELSMTKSSKNFGWIAEAPEIQIIERESISAKSEPCCASCDDITKEIFENKAWSVAY